MWVSPPLFYSCANCRFFLQKSFVKLPRKSNTHSPISQRHYRDQLFWCHWTNETKCLIKCAPCGKKNQFLAILYTFSRLVYGWKSILNYWIFWKEELFPCSSNIVFQISWLRIMETSLRLCLFHVSDFPENTYFPEMLFSGKENIFKCLVALRKMLWKIFSGVWLYGWKCYFPTNSAKLTAANSGN